MRLTEKINKFSSHANNIVESRRPFEYAENNYKYFHLSHKKLHDNKEVFRFTPRVPRFPFKDIHGDFVEDNFTPRISMAKTIRGALNAIKEFSVSNSYYAYGVPKNISVKTLDVSEEVRRCKDKISTPHNEYNSSFIFKDFLEHHPEYVDRGHPKGPKGLTPEGQELFKGCVPDADKTGEIWALEPVEMEYIGRVKKDGLFIKDSAKNKGLPSHWNQFKVKIEEKPYKGESNIFGIGWRLKAYGEEVRPVIIVHPNIANAYESGDIPEDVLNRLLEHQVYEAEKTIEIAKDRELSDKYIRNNFTGKDPSQVFKDLAMEVNTKHYQGSDAKMSDYQLIRKFAN